MWKRIPVGTKTLLCGSHQFILHPICVMLAWYKLYGFTLDPRIYIAAVVHDVGYWGRRQIDGLDGAHHPVLGASFMLMFGQEWSLFSMGHSREACQHFYIEPSRLCAADKLAGSMMPCWLLTLLTMASGEIEEYCGKVSYKEAYRRNREWQNKNREAAYAIKESIGQ